MSVIGIDILNKTINEENVENPSQVLAIMDKGLENIQQEKKVGNVIRDSMDIGLCD